MPRPRPGITCMRHLLLAALACTAMTADSWSGTRPASPATQVDLDLALAGGASAGIRVHHPAQPDGRCPVVVFSHGLAGSRSGYGFLGAHWAAHGYIAIHPDHPGSDTAAFKGLRPADIPAALRRATGDPAILQGRPRLIAAIIDALPALESAVPALAGHVDAGRIGVAGHSFGGWTTMCVAGMRTRGGDWSDPRPLAFAALSPPGPNPLTRPDDFAGCTRPVLVMTGSDDRQPAFLARGDEQSGAWRREVFERMPPGGKLLAWFDGARHCTYSDGAGNVLTGEPRPDPTQVEAVAVITLAWWDARLRNDAKAQAWLADPATPAVLGPWAALTAR